MKRIAIIGAGELGSALFEVLKGKSDAALWDVDATKIPDMKPLREIVSSADMVFCAVPSFAMRAAVGGFLPFIDANVTTVISLAKGIEATTKKFTDEILKELMPGGRWAVMGGPMLAAELAAGKECAAVFASPASNDGAQSVFEGTNLRVEISDDTHGVAVAGVLKNIYAVLMGIAAGLNVGEDETAWLASRVMEEMIAVGAKLGARAETICGTAGYADFLATAYSNHSRNRNAGIALATDSPLLVKGEGVLSLPPLIELLGPFSAETAEGKAVAESLPLLSALADMVIKNQNPQEVFKNFFGQK